MMFSFVLPLTAQTVASSGELAGHYYLSGVTEVGSELLLKPNGEFEWMLAYGADDLSAEGHWTVHESKLTLTSRKSSGKDSFQLTHTSAWNELAPTFLQRRMEEKAFQTLRENCPLDGIGKDDDYLTIAVDKSSVPARPEAKKLLAETTQRGQDAQIALDRLKTTPKWNKDLPLIEDTNRALARYRDSQAALFALDNKQHDARVEQCICRFQKSVPSATGRVRQLRFVGSSFWCLM